MRYNRENRINTRVFPVCPIERIGVKIGFSADFIHSKSEVNFTSLLGYSTSFAKGIDFAAPSCITAIAAALVAKVIDSEIHLF